MRWPPWTRRTHTRLAVALVLVLALVLYAVRAIAVDREIREGERAFGELCHRLTESSAAVGSPGAVAHLVEAMKIELKDLAGRYPRWYAAYEKDPGAYPCGPTVPNTQVGSDR